MAGCCECINFDRLFDCLYFSRTLLDVVSSLVVICSFLGNSPASEF